MPDPLVFDEAPEAGQIDLGVGQPSADLLPLDIIERAMRDWCGRAHPLELNYGEKQGERHFREALAGFLSGGYGEPVDADSLFLTAGASQGLDLACALLARAGDTVFVEEPTYFLALGIFVQHGLEVVGIPTDDQGLDVDRLAGALRERAPAFLYTIPSYHNPCGNTLSETRRERLLALSRRYDFTVVADEVYQLLAYDGTTPAPLAGRPGAHRAISLGSFSKILAPGLRLGWIQSCPATIRRFAGSGLVTSGGSLNHFASHVVRSALRLGMQETHLARLRDAYRRRVGAMDEALRQHVGNRATWHRPGGGYFFWLRLGRHVDCTVLRDRARERGVGFKPGPLFSSRGALGNCLRLSIAHYDEASIREGVRRLGEALADA